MKCFVHQSSDAVGLCRNCSRGVCADCAADRPSGIACKDRCESAVDGMDALVRRNVAIGSKVTAVHWVQFGAFAGFAIVSAMMAVVLTSQGSEEYALISVFVAGALFMGVCAFNTLKWMRSVRAPA